MQNYICYEKKDTIEGFNNFGAEINTINYTGRLGRPGTIWDGLWMTPPNLIIANTEEKCAEECYNNQNCSRYNYNVDLGGCYLFDKIYDIKNFNRDSDGPNWAASRAGYIMRRTVPLATGVPTATGVPAVTGVPAASGVPAATGVPTATGVTKNSEVSNTYFYIGLGVLIFIILLIIFMIVMMSRRSKRYTYDDY